MTPPMPPRGQVTIWTPNTGVSVTGLMLELTTADPGGALFRDEERAGQTALGEYSGGDLARLGFRMRVIDEISGPATSAVWDDLQRLQGMLGPSWPYGRPNPVCVLGEIPFRLSDEWRLEQLPRSARRNKLGSATELRWVDLEVSLSAWNLSDDLVANATPQRTRDRGGRRRVRVIRTVYGQTLRSIALAELGNQSRWRELRTWNPSLAKIDPDARLRVGTRVEIR